MVVPAFPSSSPASAHSSLQSPHDNTRKVRRRRRRRGAVGVKRVYRRSVGRLALAVSATLAALFGSSRAFARGSGGIQVKGVSAGSATVQQNGRETRITASSRNTVIDYSSFNLGRRQTADFVLPGRSSRILNRIDSATPSHIDGHVLSNGVVYFVNPAGVIFGPTAVIDVAGLYAAAAHLSNQDFLAGVNHFTGAQGAVVNNGHLKGDVVALVGRQVTNNGVILGNRAVTVVAGDDVLLGERFGNIYVKVNPPAAGATPAPGAPTAATSLGSGDMYSLAIVNAGTITAPQVQAQAGAKGQGGSANVSGHIDASNSAGAGGTVTVTADTVAVTGATIDASGKTGGGTVLVGGDAHGAGALQNANTTSVDAASTLRADATGQNGAGGKVVVWSDGSTGFHGAISARGGSVSGDGGFVETSGHVLDVAGGKVDAGAVNGAAGVWLLDPISLDITADPTNVNLLPVDPLAPVFGQDDPKTASTVAVSQITGALGAGTSVLVQTTSNGGDSSAGSINVKTAINVSPLPGVKEATLTLQSVKDINIGADIQSAPAEKLNLNLQAAGDVTVDTAAIKTYGGKFTSGGYDGTSAGAGKFTVTSTGSIDTTSAANGNGGISINHASVQFQGAVTGGKVTLQTDPAAGAVELDAAVKTSGADFISSGGGAFTLNSGGSIDTSADLTHGGKVDVTAATVQVTGSIEAATNGTVALHSTDATQAMSLGGPVHAAKLVANAAGDLSVGAVTLSADDQTFIAAADPAKVTFDPATVLLGTDAVHNPGTLKLEQGAEISGNPLPKLTGTATASPLALTLQSDAGSVSISTAADAAAVAGTALTLSAKTTATITPDLDGATNSLASLDVTAPGGITIDAAKITTAAGGQTYHGGVQLTAATATLKATGGPVTFNGSLNGQALNVQGDLVFGGATLASLDVSGNTSVAAGSTVTTTDFQDYHATVDVTLPTAQTTGDPTKFDAGGLLTFNKTLTADGVALTTNGVGATPSDPGVQFLGAVTAGSLDVSGGALVTGGGVTTAGDKAGKADQSYAGDDANNLPAVTLGADAKFEAKLTPTPATPVQITFKNAITGNYALTLNTAGNASLFGGVIVKQLTTDAGGTTTLGQDLDPKGATPQATGAGQITTTAGQQIDGALDLHVDATLKAGTDVSLTGDVHSLLDQGPGHYGLAINAPGTTTIAGNVGAIATDATTGNATSAELGYLYVNADPSTPAAPTGSLTLGNATSPILVQVTKGLLLNTNPISASAAAALAGDVQLVAGGDIKFTQIDGALGTHSLALTSGNTLNLSGLPVAGPARTLGDNVVTHLNNLTTGPVLPAGTPPVPPVAPPLGDDSRDYHLTQINGDITTAGAQHYGDAVALGAASISLKTTGTTAGVDIAFGHMLDTSDTLGVPAALTVAAPTVEFFGPVGSSSRLDTLQVTANDIEFYAPAVANQAVPSFGRARLDAPYGAGVTVQQVLTQGSQTFTGPVTVHGTAITFDADNVPANADIKFTSTLKAGPLDTITGTGPTAVTVNAGGNTTFGGAVAVGSLTVDENGKYAAGQAGKSYAPDTYVNGGSVSTGGNTAHDASQLFNDPLHLGNTVVSGNLATFTTTFTAADKDASGNDNGTRNVTFAGTVDDVGLGENPLLKGKQRGIEVDTSRLTQFGDGVAVDHLTTDAPGATVLGNLLGTPGAAAGNVTTARYQNYGDVLALQADGHLTSTGYTPPVPPVLAPDVLDPASRDVTFNGQVDSLGSLLSNRSLIVQTPGTTTFKDSVGLVYSANDASNAGGLLPATNELHDVTVNAGIPAAGKTVFGGGTATAVTVETSNDQTYNNANDLGTAAATTLSADTNLIAGGTIRFAQVDGQHTASLWLTSGHVIDLTGAPAIGATPALGGNAVYHLKNLDTGPDTGIPHGGTDTGDYDLTRIDGSIATDGHQHYGDKVWLNVPATIPATPLILSAGADVAFGHTVDGRTDLQVNALTGATFFGPVGASTRLQSLDVTAPTIAFWAPQTTSATNPDPLPQSFGRALAAGQDPYLNGPGYQSVFTDGNQSFNNGVALHGVATKFDADNLDANGNRANADVTFAATLTSGQTAVTVNAGGKTTFTGTVTVGSLTVDEGDKYHNDPSSPTPYTPNTYIHGGSVATTGDSTGVADQHYFDPAHLTAETTLTANDAGASHDVTFEKTLDNVTGSPSTPNTFGVTVDTSGNTNLFDAVSVDHLTTDAGGVTNLGNPDGTKGQRPGAGLVTTAQTQDYGDPVHLNVDATLKSVGYTAPFPTGITPSAADHDVTFRDEIVSVLDDAKAIHGGFQLTVDTVGQPGDTPGKVTFGDNVGTPGANATALRNLYVNAGANPTVSLPAPQGLVQIGLGGSLGNAANPHPAHDTVTIQTSGDQILDTLKGSTGVTLQADAVLIAGGAIDAVQFDGNGNGSDAFNLTLRATSPLHLTGSNDDGTLPAGQTVQAGLNAVFRLGTLTVGAVTDPADLTNATYHTNVEGTITTGAAQTYNDAVTLSQNTTLNVKALPDRDWPELNVSFQTNATVDGPHALQVTTPGTTIFGRPVGAITALSALTVDGVTEVDGGVVHTTLAQAYHSDVFINESLNLTTLVLSHAPTLPNAVTHAGTQFLSDASGVTFDQRLIGDDVTVLGPDGDAGNAVAINAGMTVTFGNHVAVGSLTVTAPLTKVYASAIDTAGDAALNASQVYNGRVTLLNDVTSTAADADRGGAANTFARDVLFRGIVDDATSADAQSLAVRTSGLTGFTKVVIGGSLTTDAPGITTVVGGTIQTGAGQTFGDPTFAAPNASFTDPRSQPIPAAGPLTSTGFVDGGAGTITFEQSLIGYGDVNVATAGDIHFDGAVVIYAGANAPGNLTAGGGAALYGLAVTGRTTVGGNLVRTDGSQTFLDDVQVTPNLSTSFVTPTLFAPASLNLPALPTVAASPLTSFQSANDATIHFYRTLTGTSDVKVTTAGDTTFGQAVQLTGAAATPTTISVNGDLTTNGGGKTIVQGRVVQTDGAQDFADDVVVAPNVAPNGIVDQVVSLVAPQLTTFLSTGDKTITFERSLTGNDSVTVTTRGDTTFGGVVVLTQGSGNDGSLKTDDNASSDPNALPGHTIVQGRLVLTDGSQHFVDDVKVAPATIDPSIPAGAIDDGTPLPGHGVTLFKNTGVAGDKDITFDGVLTGASDVTVTTNALTTFGGPVVLTKPTDPAALGKGSLTTDGANAAAPGTTIVSGHLVLTDGQQHFFDDVSLKPAAALRDSSLISISIAPDAPETLFRNSGDQGAQPITFERTLTSVDNVFAHVTTDADTTFGGMVFLNGNLRTDGNSATAPGKTIVKGRLVQTTGWQDFVDQVLLAPSDTLPANALLPAFAIPPAGSQIPGPGNTTFRSASSPDATVATPAGNAITFHRWVVGQSNLTVTTGGDTTFAGEVVLTAGGNSAGNLLSNANAGGPDGVTHVDGRLVKTDGLQDFEKPVVVTPDVRPLPTDPLVADPLPLANYTQFESTGDKTIYFGGSLTGDDSVRVTTNGLTTFHRYVWLVTGNGTDGSLTTDGHGALPNDDGFGQNPPVNGVTRVEGRLVHTDGNQWYHDDVVVAPDGAAGLPAMTNPPDAGTTLFQSANALAPSEIHFYRTLSGTSNVTADAGDNITFGEAVTLHAAAGINGDLTTMGGAKPAAFDATHGVTVVEGRLISTDGAQDFQDAVQVKPNLADSVVASVTPGLSTFVSNGGTDVHFEQWLQGADSVTVTTSGKTTFGGIVNLTAGPGNDGSLTTQGNSDSTAGITRVEGYLVRTAGSQNFKDDVVLAPGFTPLALPSPQAALHPGDLTDAPLTILLSTGGKHVTIERTLTGTGSLEVTTGGGGFAPQVSPTNPEGLTTFGGPVNITGDLVTDGGGNTAVNGRLVRTGGNQRYYDDVIVTPSATDWTNERNSSLIAGVAVPATGDTLFESAGNKDVVFDRTLTSNTDVNVTANTTANTFFKGEVNLVGSLTTNAGGTTTIGEAGAPGFGQVTTTRFQHYNDDVVLGTDAHLTSTGGDFITFEQTVTGPHALETTTTGVTTFRDKVEIESLTTDGGGDGHAGSVTFNDAKNLTPLFVNTTAFQLYRNHVDLGGNVTMNSTAGGDPAGRITFQETVDGPHDLIVNTAGTTTFEKTVNIGTLITDAPGTTVLNGGTVPGRVTVHTIGYQDYRDDVQLGADSVLTSDAGGSAGNITFNQSLTGVGHSLLVNTTGGGTTTFKGDVNLGSLETDAPGLTVIGDGAVSGHGLITTSGFQKYHDNVSLGTDAVLKSTAGGDVTFFQSVTGAGERLLVQTGGVTTFSGLVDVRSLETDDAGSTVIGDPNVAGHGTVNTGEYAKFGDDVRLGTDVTVTAGGDVTFAKTVTRPNALVVNTGATTYFLGAVDIGTLLTDQPGTTEIDGGSVRTIGTQTYLDNVVLNVPGAGGVDTLVSQNSNVTFGGTVNDAVFDANGTRLDVSVGGTLTFNKEVKVAGLTVQRGGSTAIKTAHVGTFGGGQEYRNGVSFNQNLVVDDVAAGKITFRKTLDEQPDQLGAKLAFTVNTQGNAAFGGNVHVGTFVSDSNARHAGGQTIIGIDGSATLRADDGITFNDVGGLGGTTAAIVSDNSTITFNGAAALNAGHGTIRTRADKQPILFKGEVTGANSTGVLTAGGNVNFNSKLVAAGLNLSVDTTTVASTPNQTGKPGHAAIGTWQGDATFAADATVASLAVTSRNVLVHNVQAQAGDITLQPDPQLQLFAINAANQPNGGIGVKSQNYLPYAPKAGVTQPPLGFVGGPAASTPDGIITINGSLVAENGNIALAPAARRVNGNTTVASAATIYMSPSGIPIDSNTPASALTSPALDIRAGGTFSMGAQEKLTVLGSLNLTVTGAGKLNPNNRAGSFADISDISTLGDLTIHAPKIIINTRPGGTDIDFQGRPTKADKSVDFFAAGNLVFNADDGTLHWYLATDALSQTGLSAFDGRYDLGGQGGKPSPTQVAFGVTKGTLGGTAGIAAYPFHVNVDRTVTVADFLFAGYLPTALKAPAFLDATPDGPSSTAIAGVLAQALPGQLPQPTEDENITGAVKEQLHEMGIYARDLTTAEIVDRAIGRVRYIEVPDDKANLDPEDLQIAAQRIPLKIAEDVLKARYAILGIGPMPTDSRKNEDAWKEEAKKRKAQIRKDLEDAFNDYLTASGKKARDANAADFATFIEHDYDKYANIVNVLDLIRSTSVAAQKKIALTEAQAQSCQDALVAGLLPDKSAGKTVRNYLFPDQTAKTAGQKITPKNEENQEAPQQQPAPAPAADGTSASAVPASATSPGAEAR